MRRPESGRTAPKISLATSVRPDPSNPASPTTSPARMREVERLHQAPPPDAFRHENRLPSRRGGGRGYALLGALELAPKHQRDQVQRRQFRRHRRPDQTAVAQDRDAVRDLVHLVDEVRDEDHRDSAPLEVAHDAEEQFGLIRVETRGRLVKDQNPRVLFERARDRDELPDGHRIGAERPLDVDVDIKPFQPLASALARLAPGDQPEPARLAAKRQVLGHRHGRDEIDFLVDCRRSPKRGPGRASRYRLGRRRCGSRPRRGQARRS